MRKPFYAWRDTLARLGFRFKRAIQSGRVSYRLESLSPCALMAGDLASVIVSSVHNAAEGGEDGHFRLSRTGSTDDTLTVSYYIDTGNSTASNGSDWPCHLPRFWRSEET